MPTERITPDPGCRICHGRGKVEQRHLPGYTETLLCDCVLDQIEDDDADIIVEVDRDWIVDVAYDDWRDNR